MSKANPARLLTPLPGRAPRRRNIHLRVPPMRARVDMRMGATVSQHDTDSAPVWRFVEAAYQLRKHYDFAEAYETLLATAADYPGPPLDATRWSREAYLKLCGEIVNDCAYDRRPAITRELDGGHY